MFSANFEKEKKWRELKSGSHVSSDFLTPPEEVREADNEMAKAKIKAKKGRTKVADEEYNQQLQTSDEGQEQPGQENPTPEPAPPAAPKSLDDEQKFMLQLAATMFTKPGPGTLREAYQHAKNLVAMLAEDEVAE